MSGHKFTVLRNRKLLISPQKEVAHLWAVVGSMGDHQIYFRSDGYLCVFIVLITKTPYECSFSFPHDLLQSLERSRSQLEAFCIVNIARFTSFTKEDVATEIYSITFSLDLNKLTHVYSNHTCGLFRVLKVLISRLSF